MTGPDELISRAFCACGRTFPPLPEGAALALCWSLPPCSGLVKKENPHPGVILEKTGFPCCSSCGFDLGSGEKKSLPVSCSNNRELLHFRPGHASHGLCLLALGDALGTAGSRAWNPGRSPVQLPSHEAPATQDSPWGPGRGAEARWEEKAGKQRCGPPSPPRRARVIVWQGVPVTACPEATGLDLPSR